MKKEIKSICGRYTARINTNSICNKNKIIIFSNYDMFNSLLGIREAIYDFSTESIKEINYLYNFNLPFLKIKNK